MEARQHANARCAQHSNHAGQDSRHWTAGKQFVLEVQEDLEAQVVHYLDLVDPEAFKTKEGLTSNQVSHECWCLGTNSPSPLSLLCLLFYPKNKKEGFFYPRLCL